MFCRLSLSLVANEWVNYKWQLWSLAGQPLGIGCLGITCDKRCYRHLARDWCLVLILNTRLLPKTLILLPDIGPRQSGWPADKDVRVIFALLVLNP